MARLPFLGMMKESDDFSTLRRVQLESYFAAMSRNMLPSQSSAMVAIRSGLMPSLAQQNAAVTALPPNETAYSDATDFSSPVRHVVGEERHVDIGLADE